MGVRTALGTSVHRPTPDAERQVSFVGLHSIIQVYECAFSLHQEQKRHHFGTVATDVHLMFRRDSTALTARASGLPHMQGVHRNLRTNPVDPRSPLQKSTHTITIVLCPLNSTDVLFCPPSMRVIQFPGAEQG